MNTIQRIVVLGGAGEMGSCAVEDLSKCEDIKELVIADYNLDKANKLKEKLSKDKIKTVFIDATDIGSVSKVIKNANCVLSCIGPFYKFEAKLAKCAIDASVNYVSICDDYDATEDVFQLDEDAKHKNVTLLTGCGWTPGLSNILAKSSAEELDEVDTINIAWAGDAQDTAGLAVIKHTYHIFTGKIKTYKNGKIEEIRAATEPEVVEFPAPIYRLKVYHLGHPEPITIPKFIKGVKTVTLKGAITPAFLNKIGKILAILKLTNTPEKKDKLANITKRLLDIFPLFGSLKISGLRVDVEGKKDDKKIKIITSCVDRMRRLTGIPAAIATIMVAKGEIKEKGVVAPEGCIDTEAFLKELKKREIKIDKRIENV